MFNRLSWLDKRVGTGDLNATVGGTTVHWAGASLRFQEHELRVRTVYGNMPGANLLDWPITLQELEPFYARAEDKLGVTGTSRIPGRRSMLKSIDPILNADVLYALRAMGHGDDLVICDTNFPADAVARQTVLGRLLRMARRRSSQTGSRSL